MNISDQALKSVAFLGTRENDRFAPRATAFFVRYTEGHIPFDYLVTAEHVIRRFNEIKQQIWIRLNLTNGKTHEIKLDTERFCYHPDNALEAADVAVIQ